MKYYTHAGLFHADEVTGYVVCLLAEKCNDFERLKDITSLPAAGDGIVADIGRVYDPSQNRFDHHQGFLQRENGYPYATAGLLWKEYGQAAVSEVMGDVDTKAVARRVDETFFQGIDAYDADTDYHVSAHCVAGKLRIHTLPGIISMFNSKDVHDDSQDYNFEKAVRFIKDVLVEEIQQAVAFINAGERFDQIVQIRGSIIVLSENVRWKEIVHERYPDACYIISPSMHPGSSFSLLAVPVTPDRREIKVAIKRPDWFDGFIHQGEWIAGGNSINDLIELAKYNLRNKYQTK